MNTNSPTLLRLCAISFAAILGLQAAWLLAPELIRSPTPFFPTSRSELDDVAAHRGASAAAARIGWPRGDLWVDYAISADAESLSKIDQRTATDEMQRITAHAAALAPYDSRAWLLLAAINNQINPTDDKTLAQLKTSYYTSPNDVRLIPLRLQIVTRSATITDDELRGFAEHDLRTIILRKPELKQSVTPAYRGASPAGKRLIEEKIKELDPNLLTQLRTSRP